MSELGQLNAALQAFVNADEDEPQVVLQAVVVYELTRFDDDGSQIHRISYTVPTEGASMAGCIGLLDAGLAIVRHDAITDDDGPGPGRWND